MKLQTKNPAWTATLERSGRGFVAFIYDEQHHTVDFIVGAESLDEVYSALEKHIVRPEPNTFDQPTA